MVKRKSRPPGRPKLGEKKKDFSINIKLDRAFVDRLEDAAKRNGHDRAAEIRARLSLVDSFPSANVFVRDIARLCQLVGDWSKDAERAEMLRATVRILTDVHSGVGPTSDELLASRRYGSTEVRIKAFTILENIGARLKTEHGK